MTIDKDCSSNCNLPHVASSAWFQGLGSHRIFLVVLAVTTAIHCITLSRSPTVWQDEVQIVDYGRVLANPSTDWSLTLDGEHRPAILISPLYAWLQHHWLMLVGVGPFQVRFFSLISAIGLVTAFFGLLRSLEVSPWQTALISLALWFDPLLVRSFAGGRADAFALMLSLIAAWSWYLALRSDNWHLAIFSGAMAGMAILSWATAPVALMLGVYFYADAIPSTRRMHAICVFAALLGLLLIMASYLFIFGNLLERAVGLLPVVKTADRIEALKNTIPAILGAYKRSPWILGWLSVAVVVSLRQRKQWLLVLIILLSFVFACSAGHMYGWRVIYVIPAVYLLMAIVFDSPRLHPWLALLLLVPSLIVNVGVRTGITLAEWGRRDYTAYENALAALIPRNATVVGTWSHYYAGRRLNWRMFGGFHPSLANGECFYLIRERSYADRSPEWPGFSFEFLGRIEIGCPPKMRGLAASYVATVYRGRATNPAVSIARPDAQMNPERIGSVDANDRD